MRKQIFAVTLLALVFPCVAFAGAVRDAKLTKYIYNSQEFVSGEVIVKFSSPVISSEGLIADPKLDTLFQKRRIKKIEKVFKNLEAIMTITNKTSAQVFQQVQRKYPIRSRRVLPNTPAILVDNIYKLKVAPDTDIMRLCGELKSNSNVVYAHPNYFLRINFLPDDPFFSSSGSWGQSYNDLWGLKTIKSENAWDFSTGQGIVVAVVDSGIDHNHQDIKDTIWINPGEDLNGNGLVDEADFNGLDDDGNGYIDDLYGWNFVSDNYAPTDGHGHGTHVSGTIAAIGNNGIGLIGLAFSSEVMPLKGLDDQGRGSSTDLANAIEYAANNGAEVINMSFGGSSKVDVLKDAIDYAYSQGVVMVAAAGNSYRDDAAYHWPSGYENVITVASTDQNDVISDFSNIGVKIDISAPGGGSVTSDGSNIPWINILSLRAAGTDMYGDGISIVDEHYYRSRGTSMAAPHVSALAALILARNPAFTNEEVRQVIRSSADDIDTSGWDPNTGYGRINAYEALQINAIPTAKIISPETNVNISRGLFDILGTASSPDFENYSVEYGEGLHPSTWSLIHTSTSPTANDLLTSWDTTSLNVGDYILRLTVTGSGRTVEDRVLVIISPDPQVGFPIQIAGMELPDITLSDVDHNGFQDIIVTKTHSIDIYDFQGELLFGWPLTLPDSIVMSIVSAAELDPSYEGEELAVVIDGSDESSYLHLYHADGTEITTGGWPKLLAGNSSWSSISGNGPTLIDIDNDGELEIIQTSVEDEWVGGIKFFRTTIELWHFDGTRVQGQWPRTLITRQSSINPSVGNIDDDMEMEIAIGDTDGKLHVFNHDGSYLDGWPKTIANDELLTTIMTDIDRDSKAEIIVQAIDGSVHVLNGDGSEVDGWPFLPPESEDIPIKISTFDPIMPTASDLDQDGRTEVIMVYDRVIYVINHDGTIKEGWPKYTPGGMAGATLNCVAGDIDGDLGQEIAVTIGIPAQIDVFNMEGNRLGGWPPRLDAMFSFTSPALADLDRDGDIEVVAVTTLPTNLYVFDYPSEGGEHRLDWPMLRHNSRHTQALLPFADANGDWVVDHTDVEIAFNIIFGIPGYTIWRYPGADVNQDGVVTISDVQSIINNITNFYVAQPPLGDDNNNGSKERPWATIQHAIDAVIGTEKHPITIHVGAGIYYECIVMEDFESLEGGWNNGFSRRWDFENAGIAPTSEYETIIDGSSSCTCVRVSSSTYETLFIDGFTIRNGYSSTAGGGISNSSFSLYITNCNFLDNEAVTGGGGIYNGFSSSVTILNCTFSGNHGEMGGGILNLSSSSTITNCVLSGNSAISIGGGIFNFASSDVITNCTITGNNADQGGGIGNHTSSPEIKNCILWGNTALDGPEIYNHSFSPIITFCDIDQEGYAGSNGNIRQDPLFVSGFLGNYYLSQTVAGQGSDSPCIDAGSDIAEKLDLDDRSTRTDQAADIGIVDMGYHYPALRRGTLLNTGQTKCYDDLGNEINPCPQPGEPFYGQDAQYSCNPHYYTKLDANGTPLSDDAPFWVMVRDNVTGLIWEVKTDDGSIHDKDTTYNVPDSQEVFIATLNHDSFGGHSDWRMPTVKELSTIVDSSITSPGPTIDANYFPNTVSSIYWSSTRIATAPFLAWWWVRFNDGKVSGSVGGGYYVRAVRGGQWGSNNFVDNGDGTVTETETGLMWQQDTAPGTYAWQQAFSYCENLPLAGYNDWRLPNRNELQSLVDYSQRPSPSIDTAFFPNTLLFDYWTSTTSANSPVYAWDVHFGSGGMDGSGKSSSNYVRAVRAEQCGSFGDSDDDGIPDDEDNCPTTPNGPAGGTCSAGKIGDACLSHGDCGCEGECSIDQEDADEDGYGDVCDSYPLDYDNDGVCDPGESHSTCSGSDNCPEAPNGPAGGSCFNYFTEAVWGECLDHGSCQENSGEWYKWCDTFQGDMDTDGIGDVCDPSSTP